MYKYILKLRNSNEKLKININGKNYFIYAETIRDLYYTSAYDFKLKEKLYILNYPLNVVWSPICNIEFILLKLFYSFIKPKHLVIKPSNRKVLIKIDKSL